MNTEPESSLVESEIFVLVEEHKVIEFSLVLESRGVRGICT